MLCCTDTSKFAVKYQYCAEVDVDITRRSSGTCISLCIGSAIRGRQLSATDANMLKSETARQLGHMCHVKENVYLPSRQRKQSVMVYKNCLIPQTFEVLECCGLSAVNAIILVY